MTDSAEPAIRVHGLTKRFGTVQAVAGVDFEVKPGELFGFLGPNGAGKTTTINMLTGLARPDAGEIVIGGLDCIRRPRAAQHLIGVVPDESNLYPELSGRQNLCFCAALYGMPKAESLSRAKELLETFGLADAADRRFGGYSKGMKRKLTIAAGIIHRPAILFLDEPTTGIDVASARQLRQLIANLRGHGTTIFLTTHYIEEAERLCDRIAFVVAGRVIRLDTVANLLRPIENRHAMLFVCANSPPDTESALATAFPGLRCHIPEPGQVRVEADEPVRVAPLVRFFEERGSSVAEARLLKPSLEEVFVELTGLEAAAMRREKEKSGGAQ